MLTYYVVIVIAVFFAVLAGSRVMAGPAGDVLPARTMAAGAFAFASLAVLTLTSAFRFGIGTDFNGYVRNYEGTYRDWDWSQFSWDGEPGIRVLTWLTIRLNDDSAWFIAITAIITIGLFTRTYAKYSTIFAFSILLFVLTGPWNGSFNGVRQYLAAAIVFAGHQFIVDRKFVKYALVVALGVLFHVSALVLILLYFVPRKHLSLVSVFALVSAALVASYGYEFAGSVIAAFNDGEFTAGDYFARRINPLRIAMAFVPYAVYVLFARKESLSSRSHFHVNMALVFATLYLAAWGSAHLARFAIYAQPYLAFAIPAIVLASPRKMRPLLVFVFAATYSYFWYREVVPDPMQNPFVWIFSRA